MMLAKNFSINREKYCSDFIARVKSMHSATLAAKAVHTTTNPSYPELTVIYNKLSPSIDVC